MLYFERHRCKLDAFRFLTVWNIVHVHDAQRILWWSSLWILKSGLSSVLVFRRFGIRRLVRSFFISTKKNFYCNSKQKQSTNVIWLCWRCKTKWKRINCNWIFDYLVFFDIVEYSNNFKLNKKKSSWDKKWNNKWYSYTVSVKRQIFFEFELIVLFDLYSELNYMNRKEIICLVYRFQFTVH